MDASKCNFTHIINKYKIQIPIIQRDYAQGRNEKKTKQIRDDFLASIDDALENDKGLYLDFIYGSIKKGIVDKFVPLDGQQRLTILFLLYWYFGKKEKSRIDYLKNFTYETRASSREFCNKLVDSDIDCSHTSTECISDQIKDSYWFLAYWKNDPTIRAILTMLDDIHVKFQTKFFYNKLDTITFKFFELKNFGLDDDLYVKMNARGKVLSDFEIFKAKFEEHLILVDIKLKKEFFKKFSEKIDNNWTDYFWHYGKKNECYSIDKFFMNYFNYVTEMLYYRDNKVIKSINFQLIRTVYDKKTNIQFLFDSLDKLEDVSDILSDLFSKSEYQEAEGWSYRVWLFDNEIDLLTRTVLDKATIQQKIFLFMIINHFVYKKETDNNYNNLKDLLRVLRNVMHRIRVGWGKEIKYTNDVKIKHVHSLLKLFLFFANKDIYKELAFNWNNIEAYKVLLGFEIDKARCIFEVDKTKTCNEKIKIEIFKFEDYKYTKGDLRNFVTPKTDIKTLAFYNTAIRKIFSAQASDVIRSMLVVENYSHYYPVRIGGTNLGVKYFFGKEDYWEIVLTAPNKSNFYKQYLKFYKDDNDQSLDKIINVYLSKNNKKNWKYYFIKYEAMTTAMQRGVDNNIYASPCVHAAVNEVDKDVFDLEKMGGKTLATKHLNPYIKTAYENIKNTQSVSTISGSPSYLVCNGLKIYSKQVGWEIWNFNKKYLPKLIECRLEVFDDYCILKSELEEDRIKILSQFLIQYNKDIFDNR